MDADINPPVAALADIRESGILAPFGATNGVPKTAPGLPTWTERASERPLQSADLDRPQLADNDELQVSTPTGRCGLQEPAMQLRSTRDVRLLNHLVRAL